MRQARFAVMNTLRAVAAFLALAFTTLNVHAPSPDAPLGIAEFVDPAQPPSYRLLDEVESARVSLGQSVFNTTWVAGRLARADGLFPKEGLGPQYNAPACASCHPGGARGLGPTGSGPAPPALEILLEMPGNSGAGDPVMF